MTIVIISKGSFCHGERVAEKVAEKLGFPCVSREELLGEISAEYNVPEALLVSGAYEAPTFWERVGRREEKFVAYVRAALLKHLCRDNVVYHGLAAQYFVKNVPHVLAVRVIADLTDRVRIVMNRDRVDETEALSIVRKDDLERRKWSSHLYGIVVADPSLYDLVLNVKKIDLESAAGIICHTIEMDQFRTTAESRRALEDLALAAQVTAALIEIKPNASVHCSDGGVVISIREKVVRVDAVAGRLKMRASTIPGVKTVRVDTEVTA